MKFLSIFAGLILGLVVVGSETCNINGDFKIVENDFPKGWVQNKGVWAKPFGEITFIQSKDGNSVKVVSTTQRTHFYYKDWFNAKTGDTVKISFDAKGKGLAYIGVYGYNEKNKIIVTKVDKVVFSPELQNHQVSIVLPERNGEKIVKVRILLSTHNNSTATYSNVVASVEPKK